MTVWFQGQILHTGRLPLFCFFVAFVVAFGFIRLSARLIRAKVRWWPGNVVAGAVHIHHMVFGVVFMTIGGVAELAAPLGSVAWRAAAASLFGLGTALVLDEFALILHLRDVYWSNEGRLSIDAVFVAVGVTALLLLGITPVGVKSVADYRQLLPGTPGALLILHVAVGVMFLLASVTLLKGKIWTGLFGVFVPLLFIPGAIRLARPGSPWAHWRYRNRPGKLAKADGREQHLRQPVIGVKIWIQDKLTGPHDQPTIVGHQPPALRDRSATVSDRPATVGEKSATVRQPRPPGTRT